MTVLIGISGAFLLGLLAGFFFQSTLFFCAACGVCAAAAAFLFPEKMMKTLFVGAFFLGSVTEQSGRRQMDLISKDGLLIERKGDVTVTGRVVRIDARMNGSRIIVLDRAGVRECEGCSWKSIPRKIEAMLFDRRCSVSLGEVLLMRGTITPIDPGNPFRGSYFGRGIIARVAIYKGGGIVKMGGSSMKQGNVQAMGSRLRRGVEELLFALPDSKGRAFLWGILLGPASNLPRDMRDHFASLGLSHLLAISGLHMAILGGTVFLLFSFLSRFIPFVVNRGFSRKLAAVTTFPVVFLHWIIVGSRPSTTRAAVMLSVYLGAHLFSRPSSAKNALALAIVGLLSMWPEWIANPGFQMSFAAVVCLCVCGEIMSGGDADKADSTKANVFVERIRRILWNLMWVSLVAGLAVGGLVAYHFGRIAVWSLPANMVAVPVVCWILLPVAFAGIVTGLLWPGLGSAVLWAVSEVSAEFVRLVELAASFLPQVYLAVSGFGVILYYAVVVFLVLWKHPSTCWRKGIWAAGALTGLLVLSSVFSIREGIDNPRVSFLNLGRGEAILIELESGHNILVDAGDGVEKGVNHCTQTLLPFLRRRNVRLLDLLIITHPHRDHMGGAVCVMDALEVKELWTNGGIDSDGYIFHVMEAAEKRSIPVQRARTKRYGKTVLELVHPRGRSLQKAEPLPLLDTNDNSLVLMLRHPNGRVLLTGDIGEEAESILETDAIKADVLKVPHHGSRESSKRTFLERVSPRYAVVCARGPPPGFQELEDRYKSLGIELVPTWRSGIITIVLKKAGIQLSNQFY